MSRFSIAVIFNCSVSKALTLSDEGHEKNDKVLTFPSLNHQQNTIHPFPFSHLTTSSPTSFFFTRIPPTAAPASSALMAASSAHMPIGSAQNRRIGKQIRSLHSTLPPFTPRLDLQSPSFKAKYNGHDHLKITEVLQVEQPEDMVGDYLLKIRVKNYEEDVILTCREIGLKNMGTISKMGRLKGQLPNDQPYQQAPTEASTMASYISADNNAKAFAREATGHRCIMECGVHDATPLAPADLIIDHIWPQREFETICLLSAVQS